MKNKLMQKLITESHKSLIKQFEKNLNDLKEIIEFSLKYDLSKNHSTYIRLNEWIKKSSVTY